MKAENHFFVPRTARYFTLGTPGPTIEDVWIVCHGYGELASEFVDEFATIAAPDRLIVAPEALSRFYLDPIEQRIGTPGRVGASWMTREDRLSEIADQISYLDLMHAHVLSHLAPSARRVRVLGFSQGVATIGRWAAASRARIDEMILWGGRIPEDGDLPGLAAHLGSTRVLVVLGTRDRYAKVETAGREVDRLRGAGIDATAMTFEGGHRLDRDLLATIAGMQPQASVSPVL
jgi:predicted esterase